MTVLMVLMYKSLAVLQLFLTLDPSLRLTHASSTPSPITRTGFQFVTAPDDYDSDYPDGLSHPPSAAPPIRATNVLHELCQYDPCQEDQAPCSDLSAQSGCLCPGLSGASQPPRPPQLQGLLPPGSGDRSDGGVVVRWCAPYSVVTGYRVVVDGNRGAALEFPARGRRGQVGVLEARAEVCVEAVNRAGHSAASKLSCWQYQPPPRLSGSGMVGLIGGGVAVLLLLVVTAIALHRRRRIRRNTTEARAEGLGNPSYSAEGGLCET
ncbi:unnamed protein product [Boreogadus saida]